MTSVVKLNNIIFSYDKKDIILNIDSLSIKKGKKVFIYGPSGSGKSTLLNLISGIITQESGEVIVLDKNLKDLSFLQIDRLRGNHIGFIFQNFNLIPYLTIYENVLLPLKSSKLRASKIKNNTKKEIYKIASHLKIEDFLNKKVTELSVGQQQRVAVARALIGSPEIIIADEPTSSLDEDITDKFMQLLIDEHKKNNFTLIFVSHDRRLSKFFDEEISLITINKGVNR